MTLDKNIGEATFVIRDPRVERRSYWMGAHSGWVRRPGWANFCVTRAQKEGSPVSGTFSWSTGKAVVGGAILIGGFSMWCEVWSKQKVKWKVMMNVSRMSFVFTRSCR